jgi:hypothetical protein
MNKTWLLVGVIVVLGAVTMIIVGNTDSRRNPAPPTARPGAQTPGDSQSHPQTQE